MTPAAAAARKAVQTRNATEEAILDAARAALAEKGFDALTMDAIARKAFVSRTAVYFYFPNKRAVVDRLIQQCFSEMYLAASPYLDGDGDPRRELRASLARVVALVNNNAGLLLLAAQLSGARGEHLPGGVGALHPALRRARRGAHRARPGARHRARRHRAAALGPGPAGHGREPHHARAGAQARRRERVDPHAGRAVVARGVLAAWGRGSGLSSFAVASLGGAARRELHHRGEARSDALRSARDRRFARTSPDGSGFRA